MSDTTLLHSHDELSHLLQYVSFVQVLWYIFLLLSVKHPATFYHTFSQIGKQECYNK